MEIFFKTKQVALFAILAVAFASCQSTDYATEEHNNESSPLLAALQSVNDSLYVQHPHDSRGSSSTARFLSIASEDARGAYRIGKIGFSIGKRFGGSRGGLIGAAVGAVAGGAGYSYAAYNRRTRMSIAGDSVANNFGNMTIITSNHNRQNPPLDSIPEPGSSKNPFGLKFSNKRSHVLTWGRDHNYILRNLDEGVSLSQLKTDSLTDVELAIASSDEIQGIYNHDIALIESGEFGIYESGDSKSEYVMNLFMEIYNTYPECQEDITTLVNKYAEVIENSDELTDDEKDIILGSLSVATYSFNYWEQNLSK